MDSQFAEIIWSKESEEDLDSILEHYLKYAPDTAHKRIIRIINGVEELLLSKQWQIDEYDSSCRRVIVDGMFRVLYKEVDHKILVTQVFPTKKNPTGIRNKD